MNEKKKREETSARLLKIFQSLLDHFGKRFWWPGETELEVIVGAVLTQNTTWKNVEKAITNLKEARILDLTNLYNISQKDLARIIRPSGFYNIKSKRLKNIINVIHDKYDGNLLLLKNIELWKLRDILLGIDGIGRETADSIILYAFDKPIFVIDAYTRRFLLNHNICNSVKNKSYDEIQKFFMDNLPHDLYLFNEYHALLVYLCQNNCRKSPLCDGCPLEYDLK